MLPSSRSTQLLLLLCVTLIALGVTLCCRTCTGPFLGGEASDASPLGDDVASFTVITADMPKVEGDEAHALHNTWTPTAHPAASSSVAANYYSVSCLRVFGTNVLLVQNGLVEPSQREKNGAFQFILSFPGMSFADPTVRAHDEAALRGFLANCSRGASHLAVTYGKSKATGSVPPSRCVSPFKSSSSQMTVHQLVNMVYGPHFYHGFWGPTGLMQFHITQRVVEKYLLQRYSDHAKTVRFIPEELSRSLFDNNSAIGGSIIWGPYFARFDGGGGGLRRVECRAAEWMVLGLGANNALYDQFARPMAVDPALATYARECRDIIISSLKADPLFIEARASLGGGRRPFAMYASRPRVRELTRARGIDAQLAEQLKASIFRSFPELGPIERHAFDPNDARRQFWIMQSAAVMLVAEGGGMTWAMLGRPNMTVVCVNDWWGGGGQPDPATFHVTMPYIFNYRVIMVYPNRTDLSGATTARDVEALLRLPFRPGVEFVPANAPLRSYVGSFSGFLLPFQLIGNGASA